MASDKKTNTLILTGVAASLAGIVAVVACLKWQEKNMGATPSKHQSLRGVQDVLSDVHAKIEEIERRLPSLADPPDPTKGSTSI